jgi:putative hemolysin
VALEIGVVIALTVINGLFAMSETAMVSSRRARLRQRAEEGNRGASTALELARNPNRFLSTVQIGISLVGVLAGAFGGATLAGPLAEALRVAPAVSAYAETIAFVLVVGAITYLSLVVGELVPKRLALGAPETIASAVAPPMSFLSALAAPAVWFLGASTNLMLRLLRVDPAAEAPVSEQEVEILLEEGARAGVFEAEERDLVRRALRLDDTPVRELMTPRPRVVWLDADAPHEKHREIISHSRHSWFPVARGGLDGILGIASAKDAWARGDDAGPGLLDSLRRPAIVPEGVPATRALEAFKRSGLPIVLLVDERGNFEGLVTPADVLASLVGEVAGEGGPASAPPRVTRREDGSLLIDGLLAAGELQETLGLENLPREGEDYQTVGGMVLAILGHVPEEGESFDWEGWRFEVVDMDGNRVDKVLAGRRDPTPEDGPPDAGETSPR